MEETSDPDEKLLGAQADDLMVLDQRGSGDIPVDDSDLDVDVTYHAWQRWRQRVPEWSVDIADAYSHSAPVPELKLRSFETSGQQPERVHLFGEHNGEESYLAVMYVRDGVIATIIDMDNLYAVSSPTRAYLRALGDQQGYTLPDAQRSIDQQLINPS